MKGLPETPSFDFLRQEAKDLLLAIRETEPEATLSMAQRALAQRYGFASWVDLKAEVERRRNAGPKVAPDVGALLADRFGLGRPAGPLGSVQWSPIGERWTLDTDQGRFMARTVLDYISQESAEISFRLRRAAVAAGVRAPEPVRNSDGCLIEEIDGVKWCVDQWIDVGPTPNVPASERIATNVGRTLARLHGTRLPAVGPITPWLTSRRTPEQWSGVLDAVRASGAEWASLLDDALPRILELSAICVDEPDDDPQLCVNDLGPASVRLVRDDDTPSSIGTSRARTPPRGSSRARSTTGRWLTTVARSTRWPCAGSCLGTRRLPEVCPISISRRSHPLSAAPSTGPTAGSDARSMRAIRIASVANCRR